MEKLYSIILNSTEKKLGESVDWARMLLRSSKSALIKYFLTTPLSNHRKFATAEQIAAAKIRTVLHESCGSCIQIEINLAKQNGVSVESIKSIIEESYDKIPDDISLIAQFADAVLLRKPDEPTLREKIVVSFGEQTLAEVSLAIATAQFHPTVKRAMGFGSVCMVGNLVY